MSPDEIKLSRQRLAIETRLKRAELRLDREKFEYDKGSAKGWKALFSPTGVVLMAAALGLLGTAAGKWADNTIEHSKQEASIILKAAEVPPTLPAEQQDIQRARNVLWFVKAGFISLPSQFEKQIEVAAALQAGQAVPLPQIQSGALITPTEVARIQAALGLQENGLLGETSKNAIQEFQKAMSRRDPAGWPESETTGDLSGRTLQMLVALGPMPQIFRSAFERGYLGGGPNLTQVDIGRLREVLALLGVNSSQIPSDPAEMFSVMRKRAMDLREQYGLEPHDSVSSQLFDIVSKGRPR